MGEGWPRIESHKSGLRLWALPNADFLQGQAENLARGYATESALPDGTLTAKIEPTLGKRYFERYPEKIEEQVPTRSLDFHKGTGNPQ